MIGRVALSAGLLILATIACGGKSGGAGSGSGSGSASGSGGSPTAPSAPVVPSAQPPAFNISGHWEGRESNATASGSMTLDLEQDMNDVSGQLTVTEDQVRDGLFAATLSGNVLTFNARFGMNCVRTVSGTASVGPDMLTGTFAGQDCNNRPISNGSFSLSIQRVNVVGAWAGDLNPDVFGGGTGQWSWAIARQNGSNISGSVIVPSGSHPADSGALSAVVFYQNGSPFIRYSITVSDRCAGTMTGRGSVSPSRITLSPPNGLTADTCRGHFVGGSTLVKQ